MFMDDKFTGSGHAADLPFVGEVQQTICRITERCADRSGRSRIVSCDILNDGKSVSACALGPLEQHQESPVAASRAHKESASASIA